MSFWPDLVRPETEKPLHLIKQGNGISVVSPFDGTNRIRFKGSHIDCDSQLTTKRMEAPPKTNYTFKSSSAAQPPIKLIVRAG
jgi:hypothetical protein